VAEWSKAPDSKSGDGVTHPQVRLLSLPPCFAILYSFKITSNSATAANGFSFTSDLITNLR
jgi:hypothetical protein